MATEDARRYLKHELGGDPGLLYEPLRRKPSRPIARVRAWLSGSVARASPEAASSVERERPTPIVSEAAPALLARPSSSLGPMAVAAQRGSTDTCPHLAIEELGGGPGVAYSMCLSCGSIFVVTARGGWLLPPIDPRDRRERASVLAAPLSTYP